MFVVSLVWLCHVIAKEVTWAVLTVFLMVLVFVKLLQILKEKSELPPGPWGYPIVGCMYFLKDRPLHLYFRDQTQKYGPIVSITIGTQLYVVISDYKMIRDTFRKEEFTSRPRTEFLKILDGYGVINTTGKMWKDQRRFVNDNLRRFGMTFLGNGMPHMQRRIMVEVEEFLCVLKAYKNEPVDLNPIFAVSISNVICGVLMSVRFSHNDPRFRRFMHLIEEGFILFGSLEAAVFIPMLKHWPAYQENLEKIKKNREEMGEFLQEIIDEHRKTFDPNHVRDLLDAYLLEIQKAMEKGNDHELFEGKDHDRQMQQVMGDLFSAGMETIKSSLQWGVLFMLHHPEMMKAVQEELDQVVGRKRLPTLEDMQYLPVTESTILEVLRRSSIVPMGTTHAPTRDLKLNGYHLPEHAQVVPLLHTVHMDPNLWEEPEKFNPSRFINAEGKVTKPEFFLPFGVGRRMCLGEVLAKMELFLFFSSLLHSFDISVPEGETLPSLKGNAGITISPNPFQVCLKARPTEWETLPTNLRSAGSN